MKRPEAGFVVAAVVLAAAAITGDRVVPQKRPDRASTAASLLSRSSYCPSPSPDQAGQGVDSFFATANLGSRPLLVRRSTSGGATISRRDVVDVPAHRRTEITASTLGIPSSVGVVESFGASSVTDHRVLAPDAGVASAPCSIGPSNRWLFASGSSARGKDTVLLLANPFEEEARLQIRVITASEDSVPSLLKNLIVPSFTQTPVLLAEFFQETEALALDVRATRGRVIASRFQRIATRDGLRGITLAVGARRPEIGWLFGGGQVPASGEETVVVMNPGEREALVRLAFPTDRELVAPPALQEIPVPAGRQVIVKVSEHLPRGTFHGISVVTSNDVGIVAERSVSSQDGADSVFGVPEAARRWVVSVGSAAGGSESLAVVNFGRSRAVVKVTLITGEGEVRPPELSAIGIEGNRLAMINLDAFLAGKAATAVIEALAGKVAVEHRLVLGDPYRDFAWSPAAPL